MAQPYTIIFGPWSPDLQNVGVQMPFQYTATPLPCADLENVYYADAAYRSLPAPASIGPTLGVQITNACNWYDDSTGKEIVFAATANGLYMLTDGTWSAVPIVTDSGDNVSGQSMQISLGTLTPISYGIAPASQSASGATSSYLFAGEIVTAPGATAYSWYFTSQVGGSFSISGGGDAMTPSVSGVANSTTATATLNCNVTINGNVYTVSSSLAYANSAPANYSGTLVSGSYNDGTFFYNGYYPPFSCGSLSPSADLYGHTIASLAYDVNNSFMQLEMSGFTSDPGQSYFASLQIGSTPYTSASATYSYASGTAGWSWSVSNPFTIIGHSYSIELVY